MPTPPLETWPRGVWLALSGRGIDVDRVARSSAKALGTAYHRPRVCVSLLLRRMIDVFVGQVRASTRSPRSGRISSDFYFDFERILAGEPLDRAVRRIGALADAEHPDGHSFVDELRERGIRIAIDLPAFSTAFTSRDPRLMQLRRGPTFAVWFDGLQISGQGEETVICGLVADQAALHGLLTKVRDLGLCLISVRRLDTGQSGNEPP